MLANSFSHSACRRKTDFAVVVPVTLHPLWRGSPTESVNRYASDGSDLICALECETLRESLFKFLLAADSTASEM